MAKVKRFADEGAVTEGENKGIGDDVRARAMKYVKDREENPGMYEAEPEVKSEVKTKTKVSKPKSDSGTKSVSMSREERIAAIPTGGKKGAGPTESKGNSASGSEVERNLSAAANTFAPAGSKIVKGATATVKGVQELVASRKAAAAAQAAREAKTLNPNAWMAGPKGMKENFKSGGSVGGASRRADGIASRGKTRGKLC
jgi:hypothetical protein